MHEKGLEKRSRSKNNSNRRYVSIRVFLDRLEIKKTKFQKYKSEYFHHFSKTKVVGKKEEKEKKTTPDGLNIKMLKY